MRQTLHKSEQVARGYIRHAKLFDDNAAVGLAVVRRALAGAVACSVDGPTCVRASSVLRVLRTRLPWVAGGLPSSDREAQI